MANILEYIKENGNLTLDGFLTVNFEKNCCKY